jgi:rhodanese-related sulfurtransferase
VLVGRDDVDEIRAAHLAAAVGITNLAGYLSGGMTSWREEKRPTQSALRIDVSGLRDRVNDVQALDVREQTEWDAGHIPGAAHTPYHDSHLIPEGVDPSQPIAVICGSGQRSAVAASLLLRHDAKKVIHVADGGVRHLGRARLAHRQTAGCGAVGGNDLCQPDPVAANVRPGNPELTDVLLL